MNATRAKDYFSSYYEGELNPSLRQGFERALAGSDELRREYAEFASLMESLGALRDEPIEAPIFLSDRIATRLEATQGSRPTGWALLAGLFQRHVFAAVAALALVGAAGSLLIRGGDGDAATGSAMPVVAGNDVDYHAQNGQVTVRYRNPSGKPLRVNDRVLRASGRLEVPLQNRNGRPALFEVKVDGGPFHERVVVPGKNRVASASGSGSPEEFARALAERYGVAVRLTTAADRPLRWDLKEAEPYEGAKAALKDTGYGVDKRDGDLLVLSGG